MIPFISKSKEKTIQLTGISMPSDAAETAPSIAAQTEYVRPWVRLWARMIDYRLAEVTAVAVLFTLPPLPVMPPFLAPLVPSLWSAFIIFCWLLVEPVLLSSWGTTPGKWLLCISVSNARGQKLTYRAAFARTFNLWFQGVACGLPLVYLYTFNKAYTELTHTGMTSWDRQGAYVVTHKKIGWLRILVASGLLLGYFTILAWRFAIN